MKKDILRLSVIGVLWIIAAPIIVASAIGLYHNNKIVVAAGCGILFSMLLLLLTGNGGMGSSLFKPSVSAEYLDRVGWHLSRAFFLWGLCCVAVWAVAGIDYLIKAQLALPKETARPDVLAGAGFFYAIVSSLCGTAVIVGLFRTITRCLATAHGWNQEWLRLCDMIDSGPVVTTALRSEPAPTSVDLPGADSPGFEAERATG